MNDTSSRGHVLTRAQLEVIRRQYRQNVIVPDPPAINKSSVENLLATVDAYHEIVDALAHEATYQAETGEGSLAYLARLKERARALLASDTD